MDYLDVTNLPEDMNEEEKLLVREYRKKGMPDLSSAKPSDVFQWFELYMSGKTYHEISNISQVRKDLVLYMAYKSKWFEKKTKHYEDLMANMVDKTTSAKIQSADTIVTIINALGQFYNKKFNKYLAQKDDNIVDKIDTKLLSQYYKAMETLDKILYKPDDKKQPMVNINMSDSQSIKKVNSGTDDITDDDASDILMQLAAIKKKSLKN